MLPTYNPNKIDEIINALNEAVQHHKKLGVIHKIEKDLRKCLEEILCGGSWDVFEFVRFVFSQLSTISNLRPVTVQRVYRVVRDVINFYINVKLKIILDETVGELGREVIVRPDYKSLAEEIVRLEEELKQTTDPNKKKELESMINELKDELVRLVVFE